MSEIREDVMRRAEKVRWSMGSVSDRREQILVLANALFEAEREGMERATEWRTMETAPRDTMLLLAGTMDHASDWRVKVGYFSVEKGWKIFGASWEPKLWMPLPTPSESKGS